MYFVTFILFIKTEVPALWQPCQDLARFQLLLKQTWANVPFWGSTFLTQATDLLLQAIVSSFYFSPDEVLMSLREVISFFPIS